MLPAPMLRELAVCLVLPNKKMEKLSLVCFRPRGPDNTTYANSAETELECSNHHLYRRFELNSPR